MARDEDDDLYDEEFDFVDDEEDEAEDELDESSDVEETNGRPVDEIAEQDDEEEQVDEYGRPAPQADYVVHIYEYQKFKRTIDRPFTAEDAEAFASEYNRTSKPYGRFAVAGKNDAKPKKALD